jgi:2-polyprenyl-6-methoxyphenol hydroxylase-like FAD-dependent oxidoreductase
MLGFLLARAGVDVVVLEKHTDFLRDFRGDTIHPSTLEVMHELGLLEEFLTLPHTEAHTLGGAFGAEQFTFVDFSHLPLEIRADLVVACDGRRSTLRERAGMRVEDIGAPMDVLWFRLPHKVGDSDQSMGRFEAGRLIVLIDRGDYWQCAYVIPKGAFARIREAGLDAFRAGLAASVPMFADRVAELAAWDQIKLLTVAVDRLATWHRPGLLCLGDAAHAMSPIGGVGVNLAVQDAVAAANLLWEPLRRGAPTNHDLARVQQRRELPARVTQWIQVVLQNKVVNRALQASGEMKAPFAIRLMARFPMLRRIPARLLGLGVRPEHVKVPENPVRRTAA